MSLTLESPAFSANSDIPPDYTCDGDELSPPLSWSMVPPGTKSLALVVDDPDAPQRTWTHWVLYNIPPDASGLAEGVSQEELPAGTRLGLNDWQRAGYGGACPPSGRHRYFHHLFALDVVLPDLGIPTRRELEQAMQGHVIEQTELIGLYQRPLERTPRPQHFRR